MTRAELAALVGAMYPAEWNDGECGLNFVIHTNRRNSDAVIALRNHAAKLLAVCEAAEALLDDLDCAEAEGEYIDALRAKLRDLDQEGAKP